MLTYLVYIIQMSYSIIYLLIFLKLSLQQDTSCIYTQTTVFTFGPNTILTPNGNYYLNTLTWASPQNSITNGALTLFGLDVQSTSGGVQLDIGLMNLTSTGGRATITPLNGTYIISAKFTVILAKTCSGCIELQYINYNPTVLNLPFRTQSIHIIIQMYEHFYLLLMNRQYYSPKNNQYLCKYLNTNITGDINNYLVHAMLSSFYLISAGSNIQLMITGDQLVNTLVLTLNSNVISIPLYSWSGYANIYSMLFFTVFLAQIYSFNYKLAFYPAGTKLSSSFTENLGIPDDFKPYQSQHCIIRLNWLWVNNLGSFTIDLIDQGVPPNSSLTTRLSNAINFGFDAICLQNCPANYYMDYTISNSTCIPCENKSQLCLQCIPPSFICTKCQPNAFFLSLSSTCYASCPAGYYGDLAVSICIICNSQCITCKDGQACLTCIAGNPVGGICINVQGCTSATINGTTGEPVCFACHTQLNFVAYNNSCICISGYRIVSQMCINIAGCISASFQSNAIVCSACNKMLKYMLKDNTCVCMDAFYMLNGTCTQICGDGKVFTLPCDDGNNIDGDGCSSVCKVEKGFTCKDGSSKTPSVCSYSGKFSTLSLSRLTNSDVENQALFIFTVSPPLFNLQQFDLMKNVSLNSSSSLSINSVKYSSGQLSLCVGYRQDIEGYPATFILSLDSSLFPKATMQFSFTIKSDGIAFISESSVSAANLQSLKQVFLIFTSIVAVIFLVSLFVHKMIGVELLISFQVVTLVHSINNNYTKLKNSTLSLFIQVLIIFVLFTNACFSMKATPFASANFQAK